MGGLFGGGGSTTTTTAAPKTPEEIQLDQINVQLGQKQLQAWDQIQPYQQQLLDYSLKQLGQNQAYDTALNGAITPEMQAAQAKADFERNARLGPIQDEMQQLQLDALRRGGAATPEQLALIKNATDASIAAGTGDIDAQTGRGIGLIADELANSRGLRLSDSPIGSEAALLSREGLIQKGSLTTNLRAAQVASALNYPLAVQQLQSGINTSQQNVNSAAQQFQAQLRNQAYQNRLALTGNASGGGIGLASIAPRPIQPRGGGTTETSNSMGFGDTLKSVGGFASGVGSFMQAGGFAAFSDRRLKDDHGVVGKTAGGLKLHLFKYKGEGEHTPLRLGVMAQEVEKVIPDAVATHRSGFKVVDYARLR